MADALLLNKKEAAKVLGVSVDTFTRRIQPELPVVYLGQLRMYRPDDLTAWINANITTPGRAAA